MSKSVMIGWSIFSTTAGCPAPSAVAMIIMPIKIPVGPLSSSGATVAGRSSMFSRPPHSRLAVQQDRDGTAGLFERRKHPRHRQGDGPGLP